MHEWNETGPQTQTQALTRLVDKAKNPAKEFVEAVATLLKAGEYTLESYGVDSAHFSGERESVAVKLNDRTTLTIQLVKG